MKILTLPALVGLFALMSSSCINYYGNEPEGYVSETVPVGYTMMVVAGISYWHHNGHYYRYWPNYGYVVVRPPHGRPPYQRPPSRPPGNPGHPGNPGERPPQGKPPSKPNQLPSTRPSPHPSTPTTRPATPSTRPMTRPSTPSVNARIGGSGSGGARRSRR
ncbi:hypothetical protein ACFQY0_13780 [Haloferula chungangensis]|uniref:Uncharacterized protein n=1 Tax=Haloferula chungangensis TaxID=1048331 RepID=A0ABW2L936_9BACT